MGITIFKIFIWGGISPDICSEIMFYGHISDNISPKNENFENSYPLIFNFGCIGMSQYMRFWYVLHCHDHSHSLNTFSSFRVLKATHVQII